MKKRVVSVLSVIIAGILGMGIVGKLFRAEKDKVKGIPDKHFALFLMMNQWVHIKQDGKSIAEYLLKKNYKTIAIYGISYAGERLIDELRDSEIRIAYGIDKNPEGIYADIEVVHPEESLKEVDAVIVTAIFFMEEIRRDLSGKLSCPILSLEDILYEL